MRQHRAICVIGYAVIWSAALYAAQASSPVSITRAERAEVVEAIAQVFAETYVFEDRAQKVAAHLRQRLANGAFDSATDREALADLLTAEIQKVEADKHIEVISDADADADANADDGRPRSERYGWIDRLRRRNYDFARVEILPGNVGYLRVDSFPPPELAGPTARAAMAFLRNSDALIIDLRSNGGGTGEMVQLLASYFFVERTSLLRTFRRASEPQVTTDYTLSTLEAERMPIIDLYVLTGSSTFSAAEAFAFALQERDRGVIVGTTTRGGANAGRYVAVQGFRVFIPIAHAMSPTSDASWDGVGVKPDIAAPETEALAVAHREALTRLSASVPEGPIRERVLEALKNLEKQSAH